MSTLEKCLAVSSEAKVVLDSWHRFPQMALRLYADGHVKMEPSSK